MDNYNNELDQNIYGRRVFATIVISAISFMIASVGALGLLQPGFINMFIFPLVAIIGTPIAIASIVAGVYFLRLKNFKLGAWSVISGLLELFIFSGFIFGLR
jgi:hypothetical protein